MASKVAQQVQHERQLEALKEKLKNAERKLKYSHKENARLTSALEAKQSLLVETHKIEPHRDAGKGEAVAVWLASDWHVEERVDPNQVNDLNEYNLTISKSRAEQFFRKGVRLTQIFSRDVEIKTVVLALLGDFITGHLHDQNVETNYLPPVEAALYAQNLIASGIEFILNTTDWNLVIPCHTGNHGRTTKFSMFGSENGHSLEYMMYVNLAAHFKSNKRVKFIISQGAHSYIEVFGRTLRFLHGHDIKFFGGVGGITIPVNKAIAQWDRGKKADITCFGHFHSIFDGQTFVANGSMIGYNAYALSIKASAERPAQQLFILDRKRGKTIVSPILFE